MINYITGIITFCDNNYIEFESNSIGYRFEIINTILIDTKKIYLFEIKNEYISTTYAFGSEIDRNTFISLLSIKGVGVATIKNLYKFYNAAQICEIVETKDIQKLISINGIGHVTAKSIIGNISNEKNSILEKEIYKTLKTFGYKSDQLTNMHLFIDYNMDAAKNIANIIKKL